MSRRTGRGRIETCRGFSTRKRPDWVGIASVLLSVVAIFQTYQISKSNTRIEGFQLLLQKYDTLFQADSVITEIERGQSGSLVELIKKNSSIDSLIFIQNEDLIEFRRLERKANYNKLQAALSDIMDLTRLSGYKKVSDYSVDDQKQYSWQLIGLMYRQVDNPFLLSNDSAFERWRKIHVEATNMYRLLELPDENVAIIGDQGLETSPQAHKEMRDQDFLKLYRQTMDMVFWFNDNVKLK
jgi:hypothetical protein